MPVPGDIVYVRLLEDGQSLLERIEPRTSTLERHSGGRSKIMAANIDLLVAVNALANPAPRLVVLDQLLAFAELEEIDAIVLMTKPDLADPAETQEYIDVYRRLEYPTIVINPKAGENVDALRDAIAGRRAMLAGNSGVGKSTTFRALGGDTVVGEVSRFGVGRQTTTAARLYRMADGFLIDSPGVNEFGLGDVDARTLSAGFREIRALGGQCRFANCTHQQEPGCAVKAAVGSGAIALSRYESYQSILLGALDTRRETLL
jgi:ribosome biogenesis GTPase / thiamine phosphate phosphatase